MKAKVVIGSAYGDEGKGVFTDYLSSQQKDSCVIRFNGGAQAGHTVLTPDGKRHVFGHFASNSFLPNSKTILSQFFVVNPLLFFKEKFNLNNMGINPEVFVHENAYITTPFEMIINQWLENSRGDSRHGSCGVGFGETIQREEIDNIQFRIKDLNNVSTIILKIKDRFVNRVKELNLESFLNENQFVLNNQFINKFIIDCERFSSEINIYNKLPESENLIFEGAQGLLLDQNFGVFPHVTRSNTGLKNVIEIAEENNIDELSVLYATRCYTTRHGAGPLKNALNEKPYIKIVDQTNIPNEYQGTLRFAYLDLDVLENTINRDRNSIKTEIKIECKLGVSCLDQTEIVKFWDKNKLKYIENKELTQYLKERYNKEVIGSWKGSRDYIC